MKFPYVRYAPFYRPVIPITLRNNDAHITYETLVDTGADISIFDAELAEPLGIKLYAGAEYPFSGIVGGSYGYRHNVNLEIGGTLFPNVPIIFTATIAPEGYGILGHEGLFNKVRLVFEYGKKEMKIVPKIYNER